MIWSEPNLLLYMCNPTPPCRGIQNLEQEVAQEEGISQALKEEAQRRETALQQLRTAVKEVSSWASLASINLSSLRSLPIPAPTGALMFERSLLSFFGGRMRRDIASSYILKILSPS